MLFALGGRHPAADSDAAPKSDWKVCIQPGRVREWLNADFQVGWGPRENGRLGETEALK